MNAEAQKIATDAVNAAFHERVKAIYTEVTCDSELGERANSAKLSDDIAAADHVRMLALAEIEAQTVEG